MRSFLLALALSSSYTILPSNAHIAAWAKGMYCLNGTDGTNNQNTNSAVVPVYHLPKSEWWMHHSNKCDEFPPAPGDFLELPAGGSFTVQLAGNRAFTDFSYNGRLVTEWGDGKHHPPDYSVTNLGDEPSPSGSGCIPSPNLHTQNETMAAGTVFAISYQSDITKVTAENLVVFTVRYHTPFKLVASYDVPAALPACPEGGCHCVWGWVPNGCGEPNMYMHPYRCIVTGATSTVPVAPGQPPVWCEDDVTRCVKGPKQMVFWNQLDGNNVITEGIQADGRWKSPGYNMKMGFVEGAQDDIFMPSGISVPGSDDSTSDNGNTETTPANPPTGDGETGEGAENNEGGEDTNAPPTCQGPSTKVKAKRQNIPPTFHRRVHHGLKRSHRVNRLDS